VGRSHPVIARARAIPATGDRVRKRSSAGGWALRRLAIRLGRSGIR